MEGLVGVGVTTLRLTPHHPTAHDTPYHTDRPRQLMGQAVAWMEKNKPEDDELQRFRAEATELLGLKENQE